MKISFLAFWLAVLVLCTGCSNTGGVDYAVKLNPDAVSQLKAFPPAEPGYQRHVIYLPELEDEALHQVSLVLGKMVVTDPVNRYFIPGSLTAVDVEGWGYRYYQLESEGLVAGTLMAVPESNPQVERFVEVNHELGALRYNSRLPIVVIVPEGFEVKYRIWSSGEVQVAPLG
jgi:ecotin